MLVTRSIVWMFSVTTMVVGASLASGQDYPNKPIRLVTAQTTGTTGVGARLLAQGISGPLGQSVVVDNRGGGVQPQAIVSTAPPDGYTLIFAGSSLWVEPLLRKTSYDPVRDFAPISIVGRSPQLFYVHPSVPVTSVKELIAYAKVRPGELNYSIGGQGGNGHLAGELFKAMAGINIVAVPYSSGSQEIADLIAGRVQLTVGTAPSLMEYSKSGKLRVLGVTTAERSALYPEVPTIAASGLPGYESVSRTVVFAPVKTPEAIIKRLNNEIVRFLRTTEAKEQFSKAGIETVGSSPEELTAVMTSQMARLGKLIKDIGIKVD